MTLARPLCSFGFSRLWLRDAELEPLPVPATSILLRSLTVLNFPFSFDGCALRDLAVIRLGDGLAVVVEISVLVDGCSPKMDLSAFFGLVSLSW